MKVSQALFGLLLLGVGLGASASPGSATQSGVAPPVADEGYYTDEYLTRSARYMVARDAWDAGYQQGRNSAPGTRAQSGQSMAAAASSAGTASGALAGQAACNGTAESAPCRSLLTFSYGNDVPIVEALHRIVPKDWTVTVTPDLLPSKVTWDAKNGRPWPAVAREVAEQAGGHLAISPKNHSVSVASTQLEADKLSSGAQVWNIVPGTLKSNVEAWARKAGWPVDWQAQVNGQEVNYEIVHKATFVGQFTGADGVIGQLFALYRQSGIPLTYSFKSNHVLVVTRYVPLATSVVGGHS